jgi:hypothetical protein
MSYKSAFAIFVKKGILNFKLDRNLHGIHIGVKYTPNIIKNFAVQFSTHIGYI